MVTKLKKVSLPAKPAGKASAKSAPRKSAEPAAHMPSTLSDSVKDSAQQIWQAGLGAFTKAQAEGSRAFEALVKEGVNFQRKTQSAAEERINEATQKMTSMASDIGSKASGQWDRLETIFEDRVAKALNKLGVPSAKDIDALMARIEALNASVQKLSQAQSAKADPAVTPVSGRKAPTARKVARAPQVNPE